MAALHRRFCGRVVRICCLALPFCAATAEAKLFRELKPGQTYEAAGGDERDLMMFYPVVIAGKGSSVVLTITPRTTQPRAVLLFNRKQVEMERAIMTTAPVSLRVSGGEQYAFIRVVPVGGSYDPGPGEHYHRFAKAESVKAIPLQPYSVAVEVVLGEDPPTSEPARPAAPVATAQLPPNATGPTLPSGVRPLSAGPRIALVIGNSRYGVTLGSLANAGNDAHVVAEGLRGRGFQVVEVNDADQKAMKRAIIAFGQRLTAAGRGTTGLFYYAGHGIQSRGTNFLVPVGAAIESEADVDVEAVAADTVLRQMEEAGASTSIVILDACRNLPVQRSFRDGARGLARMEAPNGSFVAYSTAPGSVAADGSGANSPFAAALVAEMGKPGQPIEITFRNVRRAVMAATGGRQTPWDSSSLIDSFVFTGE